MSKMVTTLVCPSCGRSFSVVNDYVGVITCPYCAELVED